MDGDYSVGEDSENDFRTIDTTKYYTHFFGIQ